MFDISTASLDELRQHREDVSARIEEMEREAFEDVQAKALALGYDLTPAQPRKERRKRRTREEIEHDNGFAPN